MNLISSLSPARVNNIMNAHKQLYKSPNSSNNSGNNASPNASWRDAYKKRCFDEFKKSRQKLLTRFRNFEITDDAKQKENPGNLKDYLAEELEKICLFQATSNELSYDEAMEIYKQIQEELGSTQYYDYEKEIDNICTQSSSFSCICPVCLKFNLNYLDNEKSCIYCSNCNFRINTRKSNHEKLTIECFADLLNNSVKAHKCAEMPVFQQIIDDDGTQFLILICDACNFMMVIF